MWVAVGLLLAQAATAATPSPITPGSPPMMGLASSLNSLQKYTAPADNVLQDLRAGLRKLQKLCSTPSAGNSGIDAPAASLTSTLEPPWTMAVATLASAKGQTEVVLRDFERDSRIGANQACRIAPSWLPGCSGYRDDKQLLEAATQSAERLFGEAAQRLDLYGKYAELEASRCTSKGFTQRLWRTEETYLWPLVTGAPEFFRNWLRSK